MAPRYGGETIHTHPIPFVFIFEQNMFFTRRDRRENKSFRETDYLQNAVYGLLVWLVEDRSLPDARPIGGAGDRAGMWFLADR